MHIIAIGSAATSVMAAGNAHATPFEGNFLAALVVILLSSLLLGEAMQRLGQPPVIGQLIAGMVLGPSFFGLVWPDMQRALFPSDPAQKGMLEGIAQFGVLLLLLLTGMDTDLGLIRRVAVLRSAFPSAEL